jgi:hypothetical protein
VHQLVKKILIIIKVHSMYVKKNDTRCKHELKSSIAIAKAPFGRKKTVFAKKNWLKFKEETSKVLHLKHRFVERWNMDTSVNA